jgi:hypothetical protein
MNCSREYPRMSSGGVHQTQGRRGNDGLLHRPMRVLKGEVEIAIRIRVVAERSARQPPHAPDVPRGEGDLEPVRRRVGQPLDTVGPEVVKFALLPVGNHGRSGRLELLDRVPNRLLVERLEGGILVVGGNGLDEMDRSRNTADGLGRDRGHGAGTARAQSAPNDYASGDRSPTGTQACGGQRVRSGAAVTGRARRVRPTGVVRPPAYSAHNATEPGVPPRRRKSACEGAHSDRSFAARASGVSGPWPTHAAYCQTGSSSLGCGAGCCPFGRPHD